ncbi:MAG: CDGSH iron-sulfur domain-containing protein [Planctomycetia bacterium]
MAEVQVRVRPNGPLLVTGAIELVDAAGNPIPIDPAKANVALCRCGHSSRKPFCDGSHNTQCWRDTPEA